LGSVKHADFVMAVGELSSAEFQAFLRTALGHAASRSINGAIHYVCMDWRHQRELLAAGEEIYSKLMNLCVWNKSNAGMGSLYRSKHELIFVFKVGKGAHVNNVALEREVAPPSAKRKILLVVNRRGVRTPIGVANPLMFLVSKGQISAPNQTVGARLKLGSTFHSVTT
jgi:hypothetical protein